MFLFHRRTQKCTFHPSSPRRRGSRPTDSAFQTKRRFMMGTGSASLRGRVSDKPAWLDHIFQLTAATNHENSPERQNFVGDFPIIDTGSPITALGDDGKRGRMFLFHHRTQKCTFCPSSPRRRGSRPTGSAFHTKHRFMMGTGSASLRGRVPDKPAWLDHIFQVTAATNDENVFIMEHSCTRRAGGQPCFETKG